MSMRRARAARHVSFIGVQASPGEGSPLSDDAPKLNSPASPRMLPSRRAASHSPPTPGAKSLLIEPPLFEASVDDNKSPRMSLTQQQPSELSVEERKKTPPAPTLRHLDIPAAVLVESDGEDPSSPVARPTAPARLDAVPPLEAPAPPLLPKPVDVDTVRSQETDRSHLHSQLGMEENREGEAKNTDNADIKVHHAETDEPTLSAPASCSFVVAGPSVAATALQAALLLRVPSLSPATAASSPAVVPTDAHAPPTPPLGKADAVVACFSPSNPRTLCRACEFLRVAAKTLTAPRIALVAVDVDLLAIDSVSESLTGAVVDAAVANRAMRALQRSMNGESVNRGLVSPKSGGDDDEDDEPAVVHCCRVIVTSARVLGDRWADTVAGFVLDQLSPPTSTAALQEQWDSIVTTAAAQFAVAERVPQWVPVAVPDAQAGHPQSAQDQVGDEVSGKPTTGVVQSGVTAASVASPSTTASTEVSGEARPAAKAAAALLVKSSLSHLDALLGDSSTDPVVVVEREPPVAYFNVATKEVTWTVPRAVAADALQASSVEFCGVVKQISSVYGTPGDSKSVDLDSGSDAAFAARKAIGMQKLRRAEAEHAAVSRRLDAAHGAATTESEDAVSSATIGARPPSKYEAEVERMRREMGRPIHERVADAEAAVADLQHRRDTLSAATTARRARRAALVSEREALLLQEFHLATTRTAAEDRAHLDAVAAAAAQVTALERAAAAHQKTVADTDEGTTVTLEDVDPTKLETYPVPVRSRFLARQYAATFEANAVTRKRTKELRAEVAAIVKETENQRYGEDSRQQVLLRRHDMLRNRIAEVRRESDRLRAAIPTVRDAALRAERRLSEYAVFLEADLASLEESNAACARWSETQTASPRSMPLSSPRAINPSSSGFEAKRDRTYDRPWMQQEHVGPAKAKIRRPPAALLASTTPYIDVSGEEEEEEALWRRAPRATTSDVAVATERTEPSVATAVFHSYAAKPEERLRCAVAALDAFITTELSAAADAAAAARARVKERRYLLEDALATVTTTAHASTVSVLESQQPHQARALGLGVETEGSDTDMERRIESMVSLDVSIAALMQQEHVARSEHEVECCLSFLEAVSLYTAMVKSTASRALGAAAILSRGSL